MTVDQPGTGDGATLPCSRSQRDLLALDAAGRLGRDANLPIVLHLSGDLEERALMLAFDDVVQRQPALRTRFVRHGDTFRRREESFVRSDRPLERAEVSDSAALAAFVRAAAGVRLGVGAGRRAHSGALVRITPRERALVLVCHHSIFDGASKDILLSDLVAFASARIAGSAPPLVPLGATYADHVRNEDEAVDRLQETARRHYSKLVGQMSRTTSPTRPVDVGQGEAIPFTVGPRATTCVVARAQASGVTPFIVALGAFQLTLLRERESADGVACAIPCGTRGPGAENVLGLYVVEQIVYSPRPRPGRLCDWLGRLGGDFGLTSRLRAVPLSEVDTAAPLLDPRSGLGVDAGFGYRRSRLRSLTVPGLLLRCSRLVPTLGGRWAIGMQILHEDHRMQARLDYRTDTLTRSDARRFVRRFLRALEGEVD